MSKSLSHFAFLNTQKILILLFVFLFAISQVNSLEAKKPKPCKKVGYFNRRDPDKLAKKLTEGIQDDSLKVLAIYNWMTCNIRYDVASFLSYDLNVGNTKSILKRRKTTCYGYAMIFKELCTKSGVRAEIVTGYTKNISVDINDSFFVGDHAWNAAFIHGRWYLFDPTWDAGYISTWKMRFIDKVVYYLSFHRYEKYTYEPEFVHNQSQKFAFKTGDYFLYDHLPENPIWQLTDKIWTEIDFRKDSNWYFIHDRPDDDTYSLEFENERQTYDMDDDTTIQINDGIAFKNFNFMNELGIVNSLNLKNSLIFKECDLSSTDTAEMLRLADSLCGIADQTYKHLDSLEYYIALEEFQKIFSMKLKNNILISDVKKLNQSSESLKKACYRGEFYAKFHKRSVRSYLKTNYLAINKIVNDQRYADQDCKSKPQEKQDKYLSEVDSLQLIIDSLEYVLENRKTDFNDLEKDIIERLKLSNDFQDDKMVYLYFLKVYRLNQLDDLDFLVRQTKDTLMSQNAIHDTDLYTNKKLVYDSLLILHKSIQNLYKMTVKFKTLKLASIRKYKSSLSYSQKYLSDTLYNQTIRDLIIDYKDLSLWMVDQFMYSNQIQRSSVILKYKVRHSRKSLLLEKRFLSKPKLIKQRTKALKTISKYQKNKADTFKRRCKTIRSRYIKK